MTAAERLDAVLKELGQKINEFGANIGMKRSQALYDIRDGGIKSISSPLATAIIEKYPQFNANWLLTGNGEMLLNEDKSELQKGDVRDVIELQAMADVLLDYVLKLKAAQPGNSLQKVADEYDTDFELRLRKLRSKK